VVYSADKKAYRAVFQEEDQEGNLGIGLMKELKVSLEVYMFGFDNVQKLLHFFFFFIFFYSANIDILLPNPLHVTIPF